jgi:hypothetical protein
MELPMAILRNAHLTGNLAQLERRPRTAGSEAGEADRRSHNPPVVGSSPTQSFCPAGARHTRKVERRVDVLDGLYVGLRRSWRLCGGRKGLVDHRRLGRARRADEDEPDHECDDRCRPYRCRPLETSSILQIHSILRRAFKFAVKWQWMTQNSAHLATVPRDAARLVAAATARSPELPLFVWLIMVIGARRGELPEMRPSPQVAGRAVEPSADREAAQ